MKESVPLPAIPENATEEVKQFCDGILSVVKELRLETANQFLNYDTGWVACSDWTNQHLGTALGGNVVHNLNVPLSDLLVKVLISTDETDANSFEVTNNINLTIGAGQYYGIFVSEINNNNIKIQTGSHGILYLTDSGTLAATLDTESWYYKIKIYKK